MLARIIDHTNFYLNVFCNPYKGKIMARIVKITELNINDIKRNLTGNPPVLIVGSVVSSYKPSMLPTGTDAINSLLALLFHNKWINIEKVDKTIFKRIQDTVPFEQIFEMCPKKVIARRILAEICAIPEPNPLHFAIAKLLKDGLIRSIITTNYDLCFEKAFTFLKMHNTQPIIYKQDITTYPSSRYYKIHGSCDHGGESMVFDLQNETRLAPWKHDYLHQEVSNRCCIFIGYSGRDFEICPEIENNSSITSILWCNNHPKAPSKNAEYILDNQNGKDTYLLVHGDIVEFLMNVFDININVQQNTQNTSTLINNIKMEFEEEDLALWALNILNVIGFSSITYNISCNLLEVLPKTSKILKQLYFILGSSLYYMGKYKQSVAYYRHYLGKTNNIVDRIACKYSIFESQRTGLYGVATLLTYFSAGVSQYLVKHRLSETETLHLLILKLNSLDGIYSAVLRYLFFLKPIFNRSRQKTRDKIISLADNVGNIGIRKLMITDHIFDNQLDEKKYSREIDTFKQLGKYFEEVVSFRRYIEWKIRNDVVNNDDYMELSVYRKECIQRGIYPEVTKISLLLNDLEAFFENIKNCEYSFYGRKLLYHNWFIQSHKRLVH